MWVSDTDNVLGDLVPTYDADGAAPAIGVQTGLGISAVTDLTATPVTDQDFGYAPPGQDPGEGLIGDTIFIDTGNGTGGAPNGTSDPGEGLEGVTVQLYASNGTTLLATTTTDENGQLLLRRPGADRDLRGEGGSDHAAQRRRGSDQHASTRMADTANQSTVDLSTSGARSTWTRTSATRPRRRAR